MSDSLSQSDADALLKMEKIPLNNDAIDFPDIGGDIEVPIISTNHREMFSLDINRKRIALSTKYQIRCRKIIVLARLDFGANHRNPDGSEIGIPHLHLYREGYGSKWAYPPPENMLIDDQHVLQHFISYCNIIRMPNLVRGLFR